MLRRAKSRHAPSHLRERLMGLATALLSDALGKTGAMDHDMKRQSANPRMAGPAATLRVHTADILMVGKAISMCPPGRVLVIDGQGDLDTALWGILTTDTARRKGLAGVVIDGAIRDSAAIRRSRFPVFARAVVPNAGGAEYLGDWDVPVQCAGTVVTPGDMVVGDEDGVVVVPAARLESVLELAERIRDLERKLESQVRRGRDLAAVLNYDEIIRRKQREGQVPQMRLEKLLKARGPRPPRPK